MNKELKRDYSELYLLFHEAVKKADNTPSWSGMIEPSCAYTKATKEFLNSVISQYLFVKGRTVKCWELSYARLRCYIMQRLLKKADLWDIKPDQKEYLVNHGMNDEDIHNFMLDCIKKDYPGAYTYVTELFSVSLTPEEEKLFKIAKCIATWIEFNMIKGRMSEPNRIETEKELMRTNREMHIEDYIDDDEMKLFIKFSDACRMGRWAKYRKTGVLTDAAHMLETAMFADLLTREYQELGIADENISPDDAFKKAMQHDIIEVFSGDAPSPCKNALFFASVNKNLRKIFEEFEEYLYRKCVYRAMDPLVQDEFKKEIVFDEGKDPVSLIVKCADYFTADFEAFEMLKCHVLDLHYFDVIEDSFARATKNASNGFKNLKEKSPAALKIVTQMYEYIQKLARPPF